MMELGTFRKNVMRDWNCNHRFVYGDFCIMFSLAFTTMSSQTVSIMNKGAFFG